MNTPSPARGFVFDIKKFAIHDGPGIRTTVFLKGCPLRCRWCHNPESMAAEPELSFAADRCIGCGACRAACPSGAIAAEGFDRARCRVCGACAPVCPPGAREMVGRWMDVDEVLDEVLKDRVFYETSGGGLTVSGGEPLFQPAFTRMLLDAARRAGLHTCLDTSGFAPSAVLESVLPFVDLALYDLKETDPGRHREYTGVPLAPILENLERLDRAGTPSLLRCPLVPGLHDRDDHADALAALANRLTHVREVNLMPYHPLGESKNARFGRPSVLAAPFAEKTQLEPFRQRLARACRVPVTFS